MGVIFTKNQNEEEMNENLENIPQENINTENNLLIDSKNKNIQDFFENEDYDEINFKNNILAKSIKEEDYSFINKKRKRDNKSDNLNNICNFSFGETNNSQIRIEQKDGEEEEIILREIEEEKQKLNKLLIKLERFRNLSKKEIDKTVKDVNKKMDKNELKKGIRKIIETSIRQDNDIKKFETIFSSLNPKIQTAFRNKLKKIEEILNKEAYIKTQTSKDENNKTFGAIKPPEIVELKERNSNLNKIKSEENKNSNKINKCKEDNNKDIKYKSLKINNKIALKDFNIYSSKCLTRNLNFTIKKGTSEATFKLIFENDGVFPWPKNKTILLTDESKSNIKIQAILMEPLNPGSQYTFDIKFRNMNHLQAGQYYTYLDFKVKGKKYGNSILINVIVIEDNKMKYNSRINVVRDEYYLDKNMASDIIIANALDKTKTIESA